MAKADSGKKTGGVLKERKPSSNSVSQLEKNKTFIVQPVAPQSVNESAEAVEVGGLVEAVEEFEPRVEQEIRQVDVADVEAEAAPADVVVEYGAGNPFKILEDFALDATVAKAEKKNPKSDDSAIDRRPLLKQRLYCLTIRYLREMTRDQKKNQEFRDLITEGRQGLVDALEAEIARVKELGTQSQLDKAGI